MDSGVFEFELHPKGFSMDTLRLIVKSILIIIFMAAFLEIVLPRSDMKRYVNLVIGLFVIIAVVNPFLTLMDKDLSFDIFEEASLPTEGDTAALIRKGTELGNSQKAQAVSQYKEKLAKQVAALAGLYPNVHVSSVDVEMVEDLASPEFGTVKKIVLHTGVSPPESAKSENSNNVGINEVQVDDVRVDPGPKVEKPVESVESAADATGLKDVITNFYGLSPDQVVIQN